MANQGNPNQNKAQGSDATKYTAGMGFIIPVLIVFTILYLGWSEGKQRR